MNFLQFLRSALVLCFANVGFSQMTAFPVLPKPYTYADGGFTSPNTSVSQVLTQGSQLNVTWYTSYPSVNLYLLINNDFGDPQGCVIGTTDTSWLWTVDDHGNNTHVFSFRIVNAQGSAQDQIGGGFYTGNFWIKDAALVASAALAASSANAASSSKTISSSATSLATSATAGAVSTSSISTSTSASSVAMTTSTSAGASSASSSTTAANTTDDKAGSSSTVAIGAGVGVGAGIIVIALAGVLFFIYRRRRRPQKRESEKNPNGEPRSWTPSSPAVHSEATYGSPPLKAPYPYRSPVEAPPHSAHYPVEAPYNPEPRELPADTSGATFGHRT